MIVWLAALLLGVGLAGVAWAVRAAWLRPAEQGSVQLRLVVSDRAESVEALVRGALDLLATYGGPAAEMIVVDAGSRDETPAIILRLAGECPERLKVLCTSAR